MGIASIFDSCRSVVAIVRQADARFVDVNAAMQEQLGWAAADVVGLRPADINLWPDADTRSRIYAALRTRQRVVALPLLARHRNGELIPSLLDVECFTLDGEVMNFCLLRVGTQKHGISSDPEAEQASYRELFLAASEGLYRQLPDGGFIDVNPAMAEILGFASAAQMLASPAHLAAGIYADPEQAAQLKHELIRQGRIRNLRSRIRRRDGQERWILENAIAVRDEDGTLRFFEGSVVDITEQVAAESALRHSENMYRVLVDNCRDGVFLIQHGKVIFANPALADMLGYEQSELIGSDYMSLVASEDRPAQARRREAREGGSMAPQNYEIHMRHKQGHKRLFAVFADAVTLNGEAASTGIARDVTDERAQLRALEDAERRYRELFEQSPIGLFRTSQDGGMVTANPVMLSMLGYADMEQIRSEVGNVANLYAEPGDRVTLLSRMSGHGDVADFETRMVCRDGSQRWVNINVRRQTEEAGEDGEARTHFAGSVQDVEHRHVIEQALQRSEARFRLLVEHSQSGVFMLRGLKLVYVNQRMAGMFGHGESELTRLSMDQLLVPDLRQQVLARLQAIELGKETPQEFETCCLHRDGRRIPATISAGPIDIDGERHLTGTLRDISRQHEAEEQLRFHASHDALTGLPNRLVFHDQLQQRIHQARQSGHCDYAVLFVDLDGFKLVNDGLGHATGDQLLLAIAGQMAAQLKDEALIARYGGDEFTLLSTGSCNAERAAAMASRLLELFQQPQSINGHRVYSGASIGIVMGDLRYQNPEQILRDADTAMYRAKSQGKSRHVFFDDSMRAAAQHRLALETDLRQALERGEFRVFYQPIVDMDSGRLRGCEALIRWQHPQRGLLLPREFLGVAEESGLLAGIDWWVLNTAITQFQSWLKQHPGLDLTLSVNLDERQFHDPGLPMQLQTLLRSHGMPAQRLQLEMTETVFRNGRHAAIERLLELKALGLRLAVDDFGTGYSSLESFASPAFDVLKIDHSFIVDLVGNLRNRALTRTIIGLAHDLELDLIAEGVETAAQRRLLQDMGCRGGQGILFGAPMESDAFALLLDK